MSRIRVRADEAGAEGERARSRRKDRDSPQGELLPYPRARASPKGPPLFEDFGQEELRTGSGGPVPQGAASPGRRVSIRGTVSKFPVITRGREGGRGVLPWRTDYVNFRYRQPVPPVDDDDLALVERAKSGETDAFRVLVVRYQRKVYAVALGIVKDPDLAWDVAQDVFVRAHRGLEGFKGESSFFTWLFRIATHVAIDSVRKERGAQRDDMDEVRECDLADAGEGILATGLGSDPSDALLRRELGLRIASALGTLPEKHRTILVLREVEGLSYEELADRLGIHKGTVMSRLFHARRKMQAALRPYAGTRLSRRRDGGDGD